MKNWNKVLLGSLITGLTVFSACTDEPVDPQPGGGNGNGGNVATDCKILGYSTSEGDSYRYTYDADQLVKYEENAIGGSTTYDFNYVSDKLDEIVGSDGKTYKVMHNVSDQITRVDILEGGTTKSFFSIRYNNNGQMSQVEEYVKKGNDELLFSRVTYTYLSGDLSEMVVLSDGDGDGKLNATTDVINTYTIKALDSKKNPFYGMNLHLLDFSDLTALTKSNINAYTYEVSSVPIGFGSTFTYNDQDYPITAKIHVNGGDINVTYEYLCE